MANLKKMTTFLISHFCQMSGTATFGTKPDNDSLAFFKPNGIIAGAIKKTQMIFFK